MADVEGLHTIGVLGNTESGFCFAKWPMMSKIGEVVLEGVVVELWSNLTNSMSSSSSEAVLLWVGFRVSKQMIPSKQSLRPRLLSALAAWTLSAFVNI